MNRNCQSIWCGTVIILLIIQSTRADPLPCYRGDNFNETLDNTIHMSDVILAGRIISEEKGEFATYSATVSYYYSCKSDELLHKNALSHSKVTNFASSPGTGMLGIFFLVREPSMQLSLLCMTSMNMLMQNMLIQNREENYQEENHQAVIKHIVAVGASKSSHLY